MELPPELPTSLPRRRLGRNFYLTLIAPLGVMAASFALAAAVHDKDPAAAMIVSSLAMFGCSVACAIMIARAGAHVTLGRVMLGLVVFLGLQVLYITCFVFGCTAVSGTPNFH